MNSKLVYTLLAFMAVGAGIVFSVRLYNSAPPASPQESNAVCHHCTTDSTEEPRIEVKGDADPFINQYLGAITADDLPAPGQYVPGTNPLEVMAGG